MQTENSIKVTGLIVKILPSLAADNIIDRLLVERSVVLSDRSQNILYE